MTGATALCKFLMNLLVEKSTKNNMLTDKTPE